MPKNTTPQDVTPSRNGRHRRTSVVLDGLAPTPVAPSPRSAPAVDPPAEPAGFDPFDPAQVAAAPQVAEILLGSDPDRPLILYKWPVTNFHLHPGGALDTFPFIEIPDGDQKAVHLIDPRLVKGVVARGAVVKLKRLYRAQTWNPDIDDAEQVVVKGAPITTQDHTAHRLLDQDRVVRRAEAGWVNVTWSQKLKRFRIRSVKNCPEPVWRDVTARDLIADAFDGKLIADLNDPLLSFLKDYTDVDPE